jgi:hypothetical protein
MLSRRGHRLRSENEIGAGLAGVAGGELVAERGEGLGAPRGSSRLSSRPGPARMSLEAATASRTRAYTSSRAGRWPFSTIETGTDTLELQISRPRAPRNAVLCPESGRLS